MQDIELRKIGSKKYLVGLLEGSSVRANSDYYPYVDQSAARTRFLQANAFGFHELSHALLPVLEMLDGQAPPWETTDVAFPSFYVKSQSIFTAMALRDYVLQGSFGPRYGRAPMDLQRKAKAFRRLFYDCNFDQDQTGRQATLFNASIDMVPYLRPQELEVVWKALEAGPCAKLLSVDERNWIALFKAAGRRDAAAMASGATAILQSGKSMLPNEVKFLVASGMVGSLMQGDRAGALSLWSRYGSTLFGAERPDLLFRLLAANSKQPG